MNCTAEAAITSSSCNRTNFIVNTASDSICQQQLSLKTPKFLFKKYTYTMRVSKRRITFNISLLSPPQINSPPNSFVFICHRSLSVKLNAYLSSISRELPSVPLYSVSLSSLLSTPHSSVLQFSITDKLLLNFQAEGKKFLPKVFLGAHLGVYIFKNWNITRSRCVQSMVVEGANQLNTSFTMDSKCMDRKISELPISTCCHGTQNPYIWSSPEGGRKVEIGKQIFCNRSLNMKNIVAVGFDMDYTLAQYKPETFESLAYEGTVKKLVYDLGYPQELLEWSFDWTYMVRGLVLDKKRGNILKMDRHKYVKVAYHGFKEMSKEDKVATYGSSLIREAFDEPDYALIDTLFSLAEAFLFAQLVDFKDSHPGLVPEGANYSCLYKDVRAAVDLCHRDGTLKEMVAKDPKRYINEDFSIVPMLKMLRDSGRAIFLVTNSLWDYTNVVMNFLCDPKPLGGSRTSSFDWLQYFDVVITGSAKPGFFLENHANLFEVEPESGMLLNTDNGTPMAQVGSTSIKLPLKSLKKSWKVFQGGNVGHLHKLLSIESSSQVLYVGDHIYGDILRSKKVLGWRTMLVVPELEREVELLWELRGTRKQLQSLRNERDFIENKIHRLKWSLKFEGVNVDEKQKLYSELEKLESEREQVRISHQQAQRECHQKFHKVWGQLMRTGYQNSRFAHQVERFACLYTSQVTNLSLYSPDKYYRPTEDVLPHEFDILV